MTEDDIDTMIKNLQEQRQEWEEVKRMARNDDMVNIDFVGTIDGEEFQGGSAKGTNLVLGSDRMIPGFEKGFTVFRALYKFWNSFPSAYFRTTTKKIYIKITVKKYVI